MIVGLKFLLNFSSSKSDIPAVSQNVKINNSNLVFNQYLYPKNESNKSIIIFSGFSVYGFKDSRIDNLARAICKSGYNVFIPQIESIENLKITKNTLDEMSSFIQYIAEEKSFTQSGNVGVLAPSFSGGMILNAIAKNKLDKYISSICTIGAFANINSTLTFILYNNQEDDYARNVLLKNFIDYTNQPNKALLKELLKTAIEDNGFRREKAKLPELLENLETDVKLQWFNLNQNVDFRKILFNEIKLKSSIVKELETSLNVINHVNEYNIPIVLIHGRTDNVIPAEESIQIYKKRKLQELPSKLCITDILDHGDASFSFSKLKEIWQLANAFNYFFKHIH